MDLQVTVNGESIQTEIEPRRLLLDLLRDNLGLTGAKRSCDVQVCGACTVLVDDLPVSACCYLAADADGKRVTTIEGFSQSVEYERYEEAFMSHAALQCGFCTAGMVLTARSIVLDAKVHTDKEIEEALSGNICRCTGYRSIVDAVSELIDPGPA